MDEAADDASGAGASFAALPIAWEHTGDGELPYRATVDSAELLVRVNDFPAEPLYSLLVNGRLECDLEDWPAPWVRPGVPAGAPYTCDVFAYFADPPDGQATAESLLFRRR